MVEWDDGWWLRRVLWERSGLWWMLLWRLLLLLCVGRAFDSSLSEAKEVV